MGEYDSDPYSFHIILHLNFPHFYHANFFFFFEQGFVVGTIKGTCRFYEVSGRYFFYVEVLYFF
jgi:hypothetical protein